MKKIRLGTIGTGVIVRSVLDNMARLEGIALEAVYSRSRERGSELARRYGTEKVYTQLEAFLGDEAVNTVYIALPNLLHYAYARRCLLAGKHVILEKPFTATAECARELIALARDRGLMLIDATPTAFLPNLQVLRQQLPRVGRVRLVMGNYSQYSSRYDLLKAGELPNIFDPALAGGSLMDINYYNAYLNAALFGLPQQVDYYPNRYPGAADTSGVLVLRYGDFVSQAAGAKDTWGVNFFQIEGEEGYLHVAGGPNTLEGITLVTRQGKEAYELQNEPNRWYYELREVTRILLERDEDAIRRGQEVMLDTVQILEAARRSAGIEFPREDG